MKVAMFPNPSGSAYWRLIDPAKYMRCKGIDVQVIDGGITPQIADWADVYVLQNIIDRNGIALLYQYQQEKGKKIVSEVDDYFDVNPDNPHKIQHDTRNASDVLRIVAGISDMVTTTTPFLASKIKEINKKVVILPNYMDLDRWDLKPKSKNSSKTIRIGWAGSMTHLKDLEIIVNPLRRICNEFPQVRLVFVGDIRIRNMIPDLPIEAMLGVPFDAWPERLKGLRLDIGLAPLQDNEFNRCKSRIKWMEYGINQVPGIFSPTVYHQRWFDNRIGMIAETEDQWYWNIRNFIVSEDLRHNIAEAAYAEVVSRYSLKHKIQMWVRAYEALFDPSKAQWYTPNNDRDDF